MRASLQLPTLRIPAVPRFRVPASTPRIRIHLPRRHPAANWMLLWTFLVYALIGIAVFYALVRPWIDGQTEIRVGADSDIYWLATKILRDHPGPTMALTLLSFGGNYLGPVSLAIIAHTQFMVMVINFALFILAVRIGGSIKGVNWAVLLALLLANAETASSLITLNKEIFVTLSAVLAAKYVYSEKRSWLFLGVVILSSLLARWEQAAIIIIYLFFRRYPFFATRPKLCLALFIAGLTVAYPLLIIVSGADIESFTRYAEGGGTIVVLNRIQAHFGFPVVLLPKIAMTVLGRWITPLYFLGPFWTIGFEDLHSMFVVPASSLALIVLLAVAAKKGKLAFDRPIAFLLYLYLIVTAVTPFIQPRYEYFVYVLLSIELARRTEEDTVPVANAYEEAGPTLSPVPAHL